MSEIVVANVFFSSDKNVGVIGGTPNTFSFKADGNTVLTVNSSSVYMYNANSAIDIKTLIQVYTLAF
jgi:hypothetical protein